MPLSCMIELSLKVSAQKQGGRRVGVSIGHKCPFGNSNIHLILLLTSSLPRSLYGFQVISGYKFINHNEKMKNVSNRYL